MSLLRLVFVTQLLVMLSGFVAFLATPADFQTVGQLFYLIVIGSAAILYASWQFIRHPARRAWAGATIATPVVCLTTPFFIVWLNGSYFEPGRLIALVVIVIVIAAFALLAQKNFWQAGRIFASRRFNLQILIGLVVLFVLFWTPVIAWLYLQDSGTLPTSSSERDNIMRNGVMYFVTVAGPAFIASLFSLLYAPVGLFRNPGRRLLHTAQLILALVTLASLVVGAFAVAITFFNPG